MDFVDYDEEAQDSTIPDEDLVLPEKIMLDVNRILFTPEAAKPAEPMEKFAYISSFMQQAIHPNANWSQHQIAMAFAHYDAQYTEYKIGRASCRERVSSPV